MWILLALLQDIPLDKGNEWEYAVSTGAAMTIKVVDKEKFKDADCAVVETSMNGQSNREWIASTAQGLTAYKIAQGWQSMEYPQPITRLKLPFKEGETWSTEMNGMTLKFKSDGKESVKVQAGTFDCYRVTLNLESNQGAAATTTWFAPGVGLIKQKMEANGQSMTVELTKTNVQRKTADVPDFVKNLVKYQSQDGKVLLFHPKGWKVETGALFGEGTYSVTVIAPDETCGVLFSEAAQKQKDSAELACRILAAMRETYKDMEVSKMQTTKDGEHTLVYLSLTDDGKKMVGHAYFSASSAYFLMSREDLWEKVSDLLNTIMVNLAYTKEAPVKGKAAPLSDDELPTPAAMIKVALEREGKVLPMRRVQANDGSFEMDVPKDWTFEGAKLAGNSFSDRQRTCGLGCVALQVLYPGGMVQPQGFAVSQYLPPKQALEFAMNHAGLGRNFKILRESSLEKINPEAIADLKMMQQQGHKIEMIVYLADFTNPGTNAVSRGVFTVVCDVAPGQWIGWGCIVGYGYSPKEEFEDYLALYMRMDKSIKRNEEWLRRTYEQQAADALAHQKSLMKSLGELRESYDRYNESYWERQKSRDYTSWNWSQMMRGEQSWASQMEGREVVRTNSTGMEDTTTHTQYDGPWNYTYTKAVRRNGEDLEMVNTREQYEKYIRNR